MLVNEWQLDAHTITEALSGRVSVNSNSPEFPDSIESLVVKEMEYNDLQEFSMFRIESYLNLKEIIIHDANYSLCDVFELSNLPLLQTLKVDDCSFNLCGRSKKASFSIKNCPSLTTITIGESFRLFTSFELSGWDRCWFVSIDCDKLQSLFFISHRNGSFCYANELCLKSRSFWHLWSTDLPSLERISFGPKSFMRAKSVVFESDHSLIWLWIDLASLKSIELGGVMTCLESTLQSLEYYPCKFDSSLVMKSNEWHDSNTQICLSLKKWLSGLMLSLHWIV